MPRHLYSIEDISKQGDISADSSALYSMLSGHQERGQLSLSVRESDTERFSIDVIKLITSKVQWSQVMNLSSNILDGALSCLES